MVNDRVKGNITNWILVVLAAALTWGASLENAWSAEPTDYVKAKSGEVTELLAKKSSKTREKQLEKKLSEVVDFRELAARALGKHWEARTDAERKEFLDLLQRLLRANYSAKLSGKELNSDYTIKYDDEMIRGDRALVKSFVKYKEDERPVDYKLIKKDGNWVVYDIVIDDVSLEETYRESYVQIIEDEGWDTLIKRMKEKISELESQAS